MGRERTPLTKEDMEWIDEHIRHDGRTIRWRVNINSRARAGELAGSGQGLSRSMVPVRRRKVYASQVAWYLLHKQDADPNCNIVFRNGDPTDLRRRNMVLLPAGAVGFGLEKHQDYADHVVKTPDGQWKAFTLISKNNSTPQHLRFISESYLDERGLVKYRPLLYDTREEAVAAAIKATKRGAIQLSLWGRALKHEPQQTMSISNGKLMFKSRTA